MKTFLVATAFSIIALALVIEANSPHRNIVPPGFLWVAAASLISAALWVTPKRNEDHDRIAVAIYTSLAKEPMPIHSLLEEVTEGYYGEGINKIANSTLVSMLDEGKLVIVEGKVRLGTGSSENLSGA